MKRCTRCGFEADGEGVARSFARSSKASDGYRSECRVCQSIDRKRYKRPAQERSPAQETIPPNGPTVQRYGVEFLKALSRDHEKMTRDEVHERKRGNGLILVIPDLHAPHQDNAAFGAVLSLMRANRFSEVVLLGDACENVSASSYGGTETMVRHVDEAKAARAVIQQIRDLHDGPMVLTEGNHCARIAARISMAIPQFGGIKVDEVGYAEMGIAVVPEAEQPMRRGKLLMIHGHQDLGRFSPKMFTAKFVDLYGAAGISILVGHTHKSQVFSAAKHDGTRDNTTTAYGLGTLEARPRWLKGASGWSHEVAVADPETGIVQVLRIVDGVLWYGGTRYEGGR